MAAGYVDIEECASKITCSQFLDWCDYFDERFKGRDKTDYYLAQIAQQVAALRGDKDANRMENFMLNFKPKLTKEEQMQASKNVWFGAMRKGRKLKNG